MNRVVFQEGYSLPFDAYRRKRRKSSRRRRMSGGMKKQQSKMKSCAAKWRRSGTGSYQRFMKGCLRK